MSVIEASFDEYRAYVSKLLQNKIDPDLAMKIMYLERKLSDVEPKAELDIRVKDEKAVSRLKDEISAKFGYQISSQHNHLMVIGRANVEKLAKLASHPDIEWITGNATPASY